MKGNNNPSSLIENKNKISEGVKKWIQNNPKAHAEKQRKSRESKRRKGEDGLNSYDKHSIFMKKNNQSSGTIWCNNGETNKRVDISDIPYGYVKGRIKFKHKNKQKKLTCPHCNMTGGTTNMKRYHFDKCKSKI